MRIAWLTTGRGPGSFGAREYTLNAIDAGLPVEIAVVYLNRDRGEAEFGPWHGKSIDLKGSPGNWFFGKLV